MRPDQFGFYATRWRNWPGQGVKQVAHFDPATTPSIPPRSQVPTLEEESSIGPNELPEELPEDLDDKPDASDVDMPSDAAPAGDAAAPRGSEKRERADEGAGDDAGTMDDGSAEAIDSGDGARTPARAGERDAEPLGGVFGAPGRNETARRVPQAQRVARQETSEHANPLRKSDFRARPASGTTAGESASLPPWSQAAKSPRHETQDGPWRPSRRSVPAGEIAAPLMRGVTANPGNPLR